MVQALIHRSLAAAILGILVWTSTALGQPTTFNFKKGQFEFRVGRTAYVASLFGGSSHGTGTGPRDLQLIYIGTQNSDEGASIALGGVTGPGKFGNAIITSFSVKAGNVDWLFDPGQHNCTFMFSRFGAAGVEGTVSCTATGGGAVPWSQGKLTALP